MNPAAKVPHKEKLIEHYDKLLSKYGDSVYALDWKAKENQLLRFNVLLDIEAYLENNRGLSLLDLGCGLGHFYEYIKSLKREYLYSGWDINPRLIGKCLEKYPKADFAVKDLLTDSGPEEFDLVLACGIFNSKVGISSDNEEYVQLMLRKIFDKARIGAAVNFQSTTNYHLLPDRIKETENERYFFYRPEKIAEYAHSLTSRFVLRINFFCLRNSRASSL